MNTKRNASAPRAFCRLELVVVLAVIALLAAIAWPALAAPQARSAMVECLNNLRRVGQGFQLWANDHADRFPWQVSTYDGGAQHPSFGVSSAYIVFQTVSNEFVTPGFLVCPSQGTRVRATSFDPIWGFRDNSNLSYFAGLYGDITRPRSWLAGDRNLGGLGQISLSLVPAPAWDNAMHNQAGNLLFADGSVAQVSNRELTNCLARALAQHFTTNIIILNP